MDGKIISEKQDLTFLRWSHIRSSSGTAGTFLKSQMTADGRKQYYKLSNFDPGRGVTGHECINEIIVDRLLSILGVEHLPYKLIYSDIEIEDKRYETYLCASEDFKKRGESKVALDDYYRVNHLAGEDRYDFCVRNGWQLYIDTMLAVDFLILNRDRHGANIEVLRDPGNHSLRIAPLFDHGLSLLCSCASDAEAAAFDVMEDRKCQNFIGTYSCRDNLELIRNKKNIFSGKLHLTDRERLFEDLQGVLSEILLNQIWNMIYQRYQYYESL